MSELEHGRHHLKDAASANPVAGPLHADPMASLAARRAQSAEIRSCRRDTPDRAAAEREREQRLAERRREEADDPQSTWNRFMAFVGTAESLGMPVRFLREVGADYSIFEGFSDSVWPMIEVMTLREETLTAVTDAIPDTMHKERTGIATVYHEATHAWLALHADDPTIVDMVGHGIAHYEGAPLENGETTSDPERLFHEAAGDYVGKRIAYWWSALESLSIALAAGRLTDAAVSQIASAYDASMSATAFGYSPEDVPGGQVQTTRAAPAELRTFIDCVLLESLVPSRFADVPAFTRFTPQSAL